MLGSHLKIKNGEYEVVISIEYKIYFSSTLCAVSQKETNKEREKNRDWDQERQNEVCREWQRIGLDLLPSRPILLSCFSTESKSPFWRPSVLGNSQPHPYQPSSSKISVLWKVILSDGWCLLLFEHDRSWDPVNSNVTSLFWGQWDWSIDIGILRRAHAMFSWFITDNFRCLSWDGQNVGTPPFFLPES